MTHVWSAAGGSITADVQQDGVTPLAPRTLIGAAGTLSALDVWVPPEGTVTVGGTAGFHGWLEPATP